MNEAPPGTQGTGGAAGGGGRHLLLTRPQGRPTEVILRMREGADTLHPGHMANASPTPPTPTVSHDRRRPVGRGPDHFADEVRAALLSEGVPEDPTTTIYYPARRCRRSRERLDGMVTFDGDVIMIEPNWGADGAKQRAGPQRSPAGRPRRRGVDPQRRHGERPPPVPPARASRRPRRRSNATRPPSPSGASTRPTPSPCW